MERQAISHRLPASCLSTQDPSEPGRTPARPLETFVFVDPLGAENSVGRGPGETGFFCTSQLLPELYFVLYACVYACMCACVGTRAHARECVCMSTSVRV